jgi:hypothetical protein
MRRIARIRGRRRLTQKCAKFASKSAWHDGCSNVPSMGGFPKEATMKNSVIALVLGSALVALTACSGADEESELNGKGRQASSADQDGSKSGSADTGKGSQDGTAKSGPADTGKKGGGDTGAPSANPDKGTGGTESGNGGGEGESGGGGQESGNGGKGNG